MKPAPPKVARIGGAVKTFDETVVVWKKTRKHILRLRIEPGKRLVYPEKPSGSWNNSKLRAESAHVDSIFDRHGNPSDDLVVRSRGGLTYRLGGRVEPDDFSTDTSTVDAPGIHCFARKRGAIYWDGGLPY